MAKKELKKSKAPKAVAKLKDRIQTDEFRAAFKSYLRAVAASAVTMGLALVIDIAPEYAVLIGGLTAPIVKWADRAESEFGIKYDEAVYAAEKAAKAKKKK